MLRALTLDPEHPTSVLNCVTRAREGARTVRDVFSAEMWEAINTFHLGLLRQDMSAALRTGPYSVYAYVRDRCGLFWGVTSRTMLRDEAHAFLQAGAAIESADMVLRMLRVALPPEGEEHARDGQALALLQAVGGFQAYRRAVPEPPNAGPVARFLLYERDYPDSVAFSVEALHAALTAADPSYRGSPAVLRVGRLTADLDFRARTATPSARSRRRSAPSSASSRRSMPTSRSATLAARPRRSPDSPPPDALRDPLPHRVPLRVARLRQPERAAGEAGDDARPSASTTSASVSIPSRGCTSTWTTSARR